MPGRACTANLFDLPTWYQYGVGLGSAVFNAWREVAAHQIVRSWTLYGACSNFPLLHHWRAMPRLAQDEDAAAVSDVDAAVHFWGHPPAVEARLHALNESSPVITLFLEHVPFALAEWLTEQLTTRSAQAEMAVTLVDQQLQAARPGSRGTYCLLARRRG